MSTTILEARELRCSLKQAARKDAFSFTLQAGRMLFVAGPPDSGKGALVRVLAGLQLPVSGRVRAEGTRGGVLRGCEPPLPTTVAQALALQQAAAPGFDPEPAKALLEEMHIHPGQRFSALSGCERYWVLLALAVAARPRLLVLENPAAVLGPGEVQGVLALARCLAAEHGSAVALTGEEMTAAAAADDLMILARGKLMLHLPVEALHSEVWEVEYPDGQRYATANGSRVLAANWHNGRRVAWVHCPEGREAMQKTLCEGAAVRPVGLQQLYWALTGALSADAMDGVL